MITSQLKADKDSDMFSISIRHGKLEARFKSGNSEVASVTSANMYNDDVFHNVVVMRTGKK
jgi:hypothetical protein